MTDRKYLREAAIARIERDFPSLWKLPKKSQTFEDFVIDVMSREKLTRRTAREYISVAIARQKERINSITEDAKQEL